MRGLCKEEDYKFLGTSEKMSKKVAEGGEVWDLRDKKEERVRVEEPVNTANPH